MSRKTRRKKPERKLPERLKKRLIGELVLEFDRSFPIHLSRISQIDERLNRILAELLFLSEDLEKLPEHIREPIEREITGGSADLAMRLRRLSKEGTELLEEWIEVGVSLAEKRLRHIVEALRILSRFED